MGMCNYVHFQHEGFLDVVVALAVILLVATALLIIPTVLFVVVVVVKGTSTSGTTAALVNSARFSCLRILSRIYYCGQQMMARRTVTKTTTATGSNSNAAVECQRILC